MNTRGYLYLLLVILVSGQIRAQDKHDFVWILGYNPSNPDLFIGGNYIDFEYGNPVIDFLYLEYDMDNPVIMSDSYGNLQYYTNGCYILNKEHQIIENGDELSPGFYHDLWCDQSGWGYLSYQGMLSLPLPGQGSNYILFHNRRYESHDSIDVMYSIIDMEANSGLGKVTVKNEVLQYGWLSRTFQAVRHGNGRDWWVVVPQEDADIYYFYLVDPDGIHGPFAQQLSDTWIPGQTYNLMCAFSPDGSKFVRLGGDQPAAFRLYDFDRCAGILSNPVTIPVPDTIMYASWACFSPNSRYLYLTNEVERLYQYDTEAFDIGGSVQLIGQYDGFLSVYNLPTGLHTMTLAPDHRIYMSSANGVNILHTIHDPDQAGMDCDFRQHDVLLPAHVLFFLPNMPFFRLYNEKDGACDTLGTQTPIVSFWRSGGDSTNGPLAVRFTDLSYYQPVVWSWNFGDGTASTEPSPLHVYDAPGTYDVCLAVCNEEGVCDTLCREIAVATTGLSVPVPDAETPVRVFPNPANEWLAITRLDGKGEATFSLMNTTGQLVVQRMLPAGRYADNIDISGLPEGIYFWTMQAGQMQLGSGKILRIR